MLKPLALIFIWSPFYRRYGCVPDAVQREALAKQCTADPGPSRMLPLVRSRVCSAPPRGAALRPGHGISLRQEIVEQLQQRLRSGGRQEVSRLLDQLEARAGNFLRQIGRASW